MIKQDKVYRENGIIVHVGEWDYMEEVDGEMKLFPLNTNWVESTEEVETMADGSRIAVSDYIQRRKYPSIADQLDYIYHNGVDAWKADMIKPVKNANPK